MGAGFASNAQIPKGACWITSPGSAHHIPLIGSSFSRHSAPSFSDSLHYRLYSPIWRPCLLAERLCAKKGAVLSQQSEGDARDISLVNPSSGNRLRAPPSELFHNALSSLDLFAPSTSPAAEDFDPQEDITVDHGQTAASVGRAIYEVCHNDLHLAHHQEGWLLWLCESSS